MTTATLTLEQAAIYLASIAGAEHTHLREEIISATPADTQQISSILRFANESGLVVTPTGGGTKQRWGNSVAPHIELSLAHMNKVREHSWQDMTCTVEAGCTWAAMQSELARHGQMVALDPLWPQRATIGGIVATNDSGALRLKFGALRDLIIGMTVVLADGTIAKTGGKVVKNVAGYDLHKLMTGSFGTLGIIASVNFRLHPIETHARTWTAIVPDPARLQAPLHALLDSQLTPTCVQLRADKQECAIDIRIATRPKCIDEQSARLEKIFTPLALTESSETIWQAREQLFAEPSTTILKVSLLPSETCTLISELREWAATEQTEINIVAQAYGLMTVALNAALNHTHTLALINHLRTRLATSGGSAVVQQIPQAHRANIDVWDCTSNALPLMREIKRRFDPNRILNPGRFVGNI